MSLVKLEKWLLKFEFKDLHFSISGFGLVVFQEPPLRESGYLKLPSDCSKAGTNSIENTGSHDSRNGKLIENGSGFRAAVTPEHEEFTRTVDDITYSVEFSDDKSKEIYVYNKEEANVEFKIKSATNKVSYVETTKGSNQKFKEVAPFP